MPVRPARDIHNIAFAGRGRPRRPYNHRKPGHTLRVATADSGDTNGQLGRSVLRPMTAADLDQLMVVQADGARAGLGNIFPQQQFPFPVDVVRHRWEQEIADPSVDCFVILDDRHDVAGFAAVRGAELVHFGTAPASWGSGLAARAHDDVLAHWVVQGCRRGWLRVFEDNVRARRFYQRRGWAATGERTRSDFAPHPVLLTYRIEVDSTTGSPTHARLRW